MTTALMVTIGVAIGEFVLGLIVSLCFFILREQRRQIAERREEIKELEARFDAMCTTLPRDYVLKDDYVRIMTTIDRKLDRVFEKLGEVAQDMQRHIGKEQADGLAHG